MYRLLAMIGVAAALSGAALAQETADADTYNVPQEERDRPVAIMAGAHLEVTLDDQMRIATVGGGTMPGEADFDASKLSRSEETLVEMDTKVGMWAKPGAIGYSLFVTSDQTNLKVSNNTEMPIGYLIALYRGDVLDREYEFTTTCTVRAGEATVESWPYLVDGVVLFRVLAPPPSDQLLCVDPTKSIQTPVWYPLEKQ